MRKGTLLKNIKLAAKNKTIRIADSNTRRGVIPTLSFLGIPRTRTRITLWNRRNKNIPRATTGVAIISSTAKMTKDK